MKQCNHDTLKSAEEGTVQESPTCARPHWTRSQLWTQPLPGMRWQWLSRAITRGTLLLRRRRILSVEGAEHVATDRGPFIFVANHSQRTEAIVVPCILAFLRGGRQVHFLADWNFALIPPIGIIYWCGGTILLTRKSAKPAVLNVFKPLFTRRTTGFERARERLAQGDCVGVYPEGTVNRRHDRLLKGYSGAARLSLESGVPVVPAGIAFPGYTGVKPIEERAPMRLVIGPALDPGPARPRAPLAEVRQWHAAVMTQIARLSGKAWSADSTRR